MDSIKKSRRKRCDYCGELKPKEDVTYTINPYENDINGKDVWENLCTECYNTLLDDI